MPLRVSGPARGLIYFMGQSSNMATPPQGNVAASSPTDMHNFLVTALS